MPNTMTTFSFGPAAGSAIACPVRVTDRDGNPWFVLADVCNALGLTNPTVAARALDEDERAKLSLGRQGDGIIVSEAGLYALIMTSRKPLARAFKRWVTHTVLPTLRKEGAYVVVDGVNWAGGGLAYILTKARKVPRLFVGEDSCRADVRGAPR